MIATTPTEIAIRDYQGRPLTKDEIRWGTVWQQLPILTFRGKHYCPRCGEEITDITDIKKCPHCKGNIQKRYWSGTHTTTEYYLNMYADVTEIEGVKYQILRTVTFYFSCVHHKKMDVRYNDVVNMFISEDGKQIYCKHTNQIPMRRDFTFNGEMEMHRYYRQGSNGYSTLDHYTSLLIYPKAKILTALRKKGFTPTRLGKSREWNTAEIISKILNSRSLGTIAETIVNTNPSFFTEYIDNKAFWGEHWHIYKIMQRNHYKVRNWKDYKDYIRQLEDLHLDTHSPKYICPADLNEAHRRATALIERREAEIRMRRNMKELLKNESAKNEYAKRMQVYAGMVWNTGKVTIIPLMTAEDVASEGAAQHHCVFQMGYWKKAENLLLTSFTADGKKQETIQINLKTMEIVQSRGLCNKQTRYHDEIVNFINAHIKEFKPKANKSKGKARKAA